MNENSNNIKPNFNLTEETAKPILEADSLAINQVRDFLHERFTAFEVIATRFDPVSGTNVVCRTAFGDLFTRSLLLMHVSNERMAQAHAAVAGIK